MSVFAWHRHPMPIFNYLPSRVTTLLNTHHSSLVAIWFTCIYSYEYSNESLQNMHKCTAHSIVIVSPDPVCAVSNRCLIDLLRLHVPCFGQTVIWPAGWLPNSIIYSFHDLICRLWILGKFLFLKERKKKSWLCRVTGTVEFWWLFMIAYIVGACFYITLSSLLTAWHIICSLNYSLDVFKAKM